MDLTQIASKINKIDEEFNNFKTDVNDKLDIFEKKISKGLEKNFEVKSLENYQNSENEDFVRFLRTGEVKAESILEYKSKNSNFEGGIPVPSNSGNLISYYLDKFSLMRKICRFQVISSDSFDVIIEENGGRASWGTPENKEPFVKKFIKTHELVAEPKATAKLIEDSRIDVEKFMAEKIAESFAISEDDAFLNGNGESEPQGILKITNGKGANAIEIITETLSTKTLFDLVGKIDAFYSQNLSFLINKEVEAKIKSFVDANGRHIWQGKMLESENNTIFGIPVFVSNFMPSSKVILGNFEKGYTIVEKFGNYVMRDPYTQRPFIKFYTAKKIGGDVIAGNAFKILSIK